MLVSGGSLHDDLALPRALAGLSLRAGWTLGVPVGRISLVFTFHGGDSSWKRLFWERRLLTGR